MDRWLTPLLYRLVPGTCILCEAPSGRHIDLCVDCEHDLPQIVNPCPGCGLPMPPGARRCGQCMATPPPFDRCFAPFSYAWPVDRLIGQFKNRHRLAVGRVLARVMSQAYCEAADRLPDLLLPVPLHPRRLRERGHNQAAEIALVLAGYTGSPVDEDLCRRIRNAPAQKTLNAGRRRQNLRQAFALRRELDGERIGIVDDVVTTGATVGEIARLLLAAGAGGVEVIALARTPLR